MWEWLVGEELAIMGKRTSGRWHVWAKRVEQGRTVEQDSGTGPASSQKVARLVGNGDRPGGEQPLGTFGGVFFFVSLGVVCLGGGRKRQRKKGPLQPLQRRKKGEGMLLH